MRDPFKLFLVARAVSRFGDGFFTLGVAWTVYQKTHSIVALGLLYGAYRASVALTQTLAAPRMARMNPRTVLIMLDLLAGLGVLFPVLLAAEGHLHAWVLYAVFVWLGALAMPAGAVVRTMVPHLVPPSALRRANGRLDGVLETSVILGSTVAGLVIARYGTSIAWSVDAVSFAMAALLTASIPAMPDPEPPAPISYWSSMFQGGRIVVRTARIRALTGLVTVQGVVDTAFPVLVVPLVLLSLHDTVRGVGYLNGALSLGAIAGAALLETRVGSRWPRGRYLVTVFCLSTAAIGVVPLLPWAFATQVAAGILMVLFQVDWTSRYQESVPTSELHWVMMFQTSVAGVAEALGAVITGFLASSLGVAPAFLIWGLLGALGALAVLEGRRPEALPPVQAMGE